MTQRAGTPRCSGLFFALAVTAAALTFAGPVAHAVEPVVPNIRAAPRGVAPPRIPPRPAPGVIPKRIPPGGIGTGPAMVRPSPGARGDLCRSSCASRCQMVSCSGLSVSKCASVRQQCRVSCQTSCR
ncbi:hypothetical protein [Hyphomicrobium sp.]|uniref:hypothetical protein n=1 Tax=Hyphomicrobium sp. TaxID=82 RepID=UPI002FDC7F92